MTLTAQQKDQYAQEGYTLLGKILTDAQLDDLRREEARFRELQPPAPGEVTLFRSQVAHYSAPVRDFVTQGAHIAVLPTLVKSETIAFWFCQYVTKLSDSTSGRSEFPWHQDNGYVGFDPPSNVTIWIALDDVDEQNGCVWVAPQSHLGGPLPHAAKSADSWHLEVPVEGDGIPVRLKAGEAVAFTGLTLHRSLLNHTNKPRRAFFMEYCDATARYGDRGMIEGKRIINSGQSWIVSGELPWPPDLTEVPMY